MNVNGNIDPNQLSPISGPSEQGKVPPKTSTPILENSILPEKPESGPITNDERDGNMAKISGERPEDSAVVASLKNQGKFSEAKNIAVLGYFANSPK